MRSALLSTFAVMALAGGCVGSLETTPPGGPGPNPGGPDAGNVSATNAKPEFDQNVYPIVKAKCIGCHSSAGPAGNVTGFVATDAAQGYVTLTGYTALVGNYTPTSAALLNKVSAGHQGITYTADELSKITGWLEKEASLRSGAGPDPTPQPGTESPSAATERLLKQWSGCMSLANFTQANMADAWGNLTTTNNQECKNCHVSGAEGFIATDVPEPFFNVVSSDKYYMLQYFTVDLSGGTAAAKVIINTTSFNGVSQGQDPHRQHPRFNATDNNGMRALQSFYDLTTARMAAGTCDPSRLTN
ncbi:MAG: hypothetical protein K8W52_10140 [Deltaproteobacteria bacterium]|nr:hypothetical protein [Deltaproteobacteria bacterium]